MKPTILNLNELPYAQLTDLHSIVRKSLKEVDQHLSQYGPTKASIIDADTWSLCRKHMFLTKLRIQIKERILAIADTVNIS
jgi:hypothetical protein